MFEGITGVGKNAQLRACYVDEERFVCENHVNVIHGKKEVLQKLLPYIQSSKSIKVLQNITGNTQISKTELENLLPLWVKE